MTPQRLYISADVEPTPTESTTDVVYSLNSIEGKGEQRFLVMLRGRRGRLAAKAIKEAGIKVIMPITADHRLDSSATEADETVMLGDAYSDMLYGNAYAVLNAAQEAKATAIILGDEALSLAAVDSFLSHARRLGIGVYRPLEVEGKLLGLAKCEPKGPDRGEPIWRQCQNCKLTFDESSLAKQHYSCPACGSLMRLNSEQRINELLDIDSFEEWNADMPVANPLDFEGYEEKLDGLRESSGLREAVCTGRAHIVGLPLAIGIMDSTFLMGSMGSVVGEKIARLFDRATEEGLAVVMLCASGGARMQEGVISLMQMAKVSCAVRRHSDAGLVYISVITDPTTGGVTASFAMQGDIILAEPGALVGFAGKRVIKDTIKQELPEGFQTAEFALEHGLIDAVVPRQDLRSTLAQLIALHMNLDGITEEELEVTYRSVKEGLEKGTATYNHVTYGPATIVDEKDIRETAGNPVLEFIRRRFLADDESKLERKMSRAARKKGVHPWKSAPLEGQDGAEVDRNAEVAWENVQLARNIHRPTARYYLERLTDGFIELHGDREVGDDGAIVAGVAWIGNRPVTVITQEKGEDVKERVRRNFGCPQPEGYRKSLRLMRQAEKFRRPVICLVDTQGAYCGTTAEEHGQGNAIAENLEALAGLTVPVISVLIGEGGSGGALALALANTVAMQEHAVYSVITPEGFASILWKDSARAPEAAAAMKMSAEDALAMGVVDDVLSEGDGPANENPEQAAENLIDYVETSLDALSEMTGEELKAQRQERFARF